MIITISTNGTWLGGPLAVDGRVQGKYLGTPFTGTATHWRGKILVALDEPLAPGAGGGCHFTGKEQILIATTSHEYDDTEARRPWGATVTRIVGWQPDTYVEPQSEESKS